LGIYLSNKATQLDWEFAQEVLLVCIAKRTVVLGSFTRGIAELFVLPWWIQCLRLVQSLGCPGRYEFGAFTLEFFSPKFD
jgi:hypothetical protein